PERASAAGQSAASHAGREATAGQYRVKRGDSLGRIATQLKPADISLDLMLVALYRANPNAFIGNNMNRLKSGQILSVPTADEARGIAEGEAHGIVVAHAADFNAYRNKLAGQVAAASPAPAPQAGQSATGRVTAKVEERPTAANEAQDQLRLSKATGPGAVGKGGTSNSEEAIARQKELDEAQARVKELEKNVSDLEKLMSVKSKAGADALANAKQESAAPAPAKPSPAATKPEPAKKAIVPAPKKAAPAPAPSLFDTLMDNVTYIAAGAVVLLLGAFGVAQRRKNKPEPKKAATEPSVLGVPPADQAPSLFAQAGGQSIDTNNSVFNSSFAPSASQLDTNEVDPVAEADVYIAYGRDAQAEEILKEALRTHPERYPVRLKLLEIYAARKDLRAFETQASELYGMTRGQGDEWAQAAALGLLIDPLNPLFSNGGTPAAHPSLEERGQQALLAQQLEQAFRGDEPAATADAQLDHELTALPEPAGQAKTEDDHLLDFDLGGLSFEPVESLDPTAAPTPDDAEKPEPTAVSDLDFDMEPFPPLAAPAAEAVPATQAQDESFDLAFDTDFDESPAKPAQDEDALALDLSLSGPATDINMADLAKEFDLPNVPAATEQAAPASEQKDPLFDLDAMSFELPGSAPKEAAPAATEPKSTLAELDAMDFEAPASEPVAAPFEDTIVLEDEPFASIGQAGAPADSPLPSFDMSGIDLDLPEQEHAGEPLPEAEISAGGEMSAAHMEMETKLDLAIAYQEIGDKEGARELLEEVIKGGNSEQVSKASAMRAKLA
ncbi:FimV/HubP family polar landmark protein, partial [Massilia horti]